MKKNSKGFTLIELLAVIVILAIIALIATPIVLNLIDKARAGAAQDAAYGVRKAAQLYYSTKMIEDPEGFYTQVTFECNGTACVNKADTEGKDKLELDGTVPSAGEIVIASDGTISGTGITINAQKCKKFGSSGKIECGRNVTEAEQS